MPRKRLIPSTDLSVDQWLYAAARCGETGVAGLQTYSRSVDVTDAENEELTSLILFGAALQREEGADVPKRIWGIVPLRSTPRWAMFQVSPARDQHGRGTFMIRALLFPDAAAFDQLAHPPACYCGSVNLTEHLTREQLDNASRPPPLPGIPLSDLQPGADYSVASLQSTMIGQPPEACASLLRASLGDPTKFIIAGSEAEILAAFSLAWAASSLQDRATLGFVSWWPDHIQLAAALLGWPKTLPKPSPAYLNVVRKTFRWDRVKPTDYTPMENELAALVHNSGLLAVTDRSTDWRGSRFASASARPLINNQSFNLEELLHPDQREKLLQELSRASQATRLESVEAKKLFELLSYQKCQIASECPAEVVRNVLLPLARNIVKMQIFSDYPLVEGIIHRQVMRLIEAWWQNTESQSAQASTYCPWAEMFAWSSECSNSETYAEYLTQEVDSTFVDSKSAEQGYSLTCAVLLAECHGRSPPSVTDPGQTAIITKGAALVTDSNSPRVRFGFLDLACVKPAVSVEIARHWSKSAAILEDTEFTEKWVASAAAGKDGTRYLDQFGDRLFNLPSRLRQDFLCTWFRLMSGNAHSVGRDWRYFLDRLKRMQQGSADLISRVLPCVCDSLSASEWLSIAPWVGRFDYDLRSSYFERLDVAVRNAPPLQWLNVSPDPEVFRSLKDHISRDSRPYANAAILTIYILSSREIIEKFHYYSQWISTPDDIWSVKLQEGFLVVAFHKCGNPEQLFRLGCDLIRLLPFRVTDESIKTIRAGLVAKEASPVMLEAFAQLCESREMKSELKASKQLMRSESGLFSPFVRLWNRVFGSDDLQTASVKKKAKSISWKFSLSVFFALGLVVFFVGHHFRIPRIYWDLFLIIFFPIIVLFLVLALVFNDEIDR